MNREAAAKIKHLRQETQYTCTVAAMVSCMSALDKEQTEQDVNRILGAEPQQGASWEQVLAALQYFGMRGTLVVPATIAMLRQWTNAGTPVLIGWTPRDRPWAHASVVFDVDDTNVYVMDPNLPDPNQTTIVVPHADFYTKWFEKHSESLFVRRPALAVTREVDVDGRQVMAAIRGKTAKVLPKIWVVHDPSDVSELKDILFEADPIYLAKYAIGTGLHQWTEENHTFHDSKDSALKDAQARLGKAGKTAAVDLKAFLGRVPTTRAYLLKLQTKWKQYSAKLSMLEEKYNKIEAAQGRDSEEAKEAAWLWTRARESDENPVGEIGSALRNVHMAVQQINNAHLTRGDRVRVNKVLHSTDDPHGLGAGVGHQVVQALGLLDILEDVCKREVGKTASQPLSLQYDYGYRKDLRRDTSKLPEDVDITASKVAARYLARKGV